MEEKRKRYGQIGNKNKLNKYYFTFGFGQVHQNCYTVIKAERVYDARERMVEKFGLQWAFQYSEKEWICDNGKTQAEEYNLKEIK
jgi:hypothetical protein